MSVWGSIFTAVLGGVANSSDKKAQAGLTKDQIKWTGLEERKGLAFADNLEDYRTQKRRHETSRALGSQYNQFSTVRNFAPNFQPGTGLDAMPVQKKPEDY